MRGNAHKATYHKEVAHAVSEVIHDDPVKVVGVAQEA